MRKLTLLTFKSRKNRRFDVLIYSLKCKKYKNRKIGEVLDWKN